MSESESSERESVPQLRQRRSVIKGHCPDTNEIVPSMTNEKPAICGEEEETTFIGMRPNCELNVFEGAVDRVLYAEWRDAACDSDFHRVPDGVRSKPQWDMNIVRSW